MFNLVIGCLLWFLGMFAFNLLIKLFAFAASRMTRPEDFRRKLEKQDERRYMPKEMLTKI